MNEVILIILIGLSPGNPDHPALKVMEYPQESMETCIIEKEKIMKQDRNIYVDFDLSAMCVNRQTQENIRQR